MNKYVVATVKPWNIDAFHQNVEKMPGKWYLVNSNEELTLEYLQKINPRYIFFPHWSWNVPDEITKIFECVCFHMTDVPFGRGGSPLQNLICRGYKKTKLSALQMVRELDAGPVYEKLDLLLNGRAQEIYERAAYLTYELIKLIVSEELKPSPQQGEPTIFKRRRPEESYLPDSGDIEKLYDHIRMLDADSYPNAFLKHGEFILKLTNASLNKDNLECKVTFTKAK